MDASLVVQFWVVALALVLTPGADWACAIAAGLHDRSPVPAVSGIIAGYVLVVTCLALGVGALVTAHPSALIVMTTAGSAYLLYLGATILRRAPDEIRASTSGLGEAAIAQFMRGAGVSTMNPKGVLLLIALLPQFTTPNGWPAPAQMLALGGIHILDCTVVYSAVAHFARQVLRSRPRARLGVARISGALIDPRRSWHPRRTDRRYPLTVSGRVPGPPFDASRAPVTSVSMCRRAPVGGGPVCFRGALASLRIVAMRWRSTLRHDDAPAHLRPPRHCRP